MTSEPGSQESVVAKPVAAEPVSQAPSAGSTERRIAEGRNPIPRRLVRWYVSPSGALFLVSLSLAAASLAGVPGARWYGLAGLVAMAVFVPYKFSQEQVRNDSRLDMRASTLDRAVTNSVASLRQAAGALSDRVDSTEEELAFGKDEMERSAGLLQAAEDRVVDLQQLVAHIEKQTELLDVETTRLEQSIEKQSVAAIRTREDLVRERKQRVDAFANALDTLSSSLYPTWGYSNSQSYVGTRSAAAHPVKGRRLIFAATSGRAGSHYLAQLLGSAEDVYATHESPPYMIGHHLRAVVDRPLAETYDNRRIKAMAIQAILAGLPRQVAYAETNHMFIKTFHDVVINEFDQSDLSVVLLRRRLDKVLKSFLELGYFTQDNNDWVHWMHLPHGVNLVAQPPGSIENFDDVDRAIGYLFDIEARMQRLPVEYPGINVVEAAIEEISTNEGAERLLGQLGLKSTLHTQIVAGHRTNSRTTLKLREVDIDECRSRIVAYHGRAEEAGVFVPDISQLLHD